MPDEDDDLFGEGGDEAADDLDRLTELLFQHISEFAEDEDLPDEVLSLLLLRLSVTTRMMTYVMSVAKPSSAGLKLDLDRYSREVDEIVREMKKDANRLIAEAKETIATAGLDEDEDEDEDNES